MGRGGGGLTNSLDGGRFLVEGLRHDFGLVKVVKVLEGGEIGSKTSSVFVV